MGRMNIFSLRATVKGINRRQFILKVASVVAGISIVILLFFYGMAVFAEKTGSFTVNAPENSKGFNIALCENPEFEKSFTKLFADPLDEMDNIAESWLPDDIDSGEYYGSHNGYAYIAYTFYVKNLGETTVNYSVSIDIEECVLDVDEAIRIKVYHNGEATVYAKRQKDSIEPVPNTTPFYSSKQAMYTERENFMKDEIDKFTVVIWLEGDDPECTDAIKGGKVKFSMNFNISN